MPVLPLRFACLICLISMYSNQAEADRIKHWNSKSVILYDAPSATSNKTIESADKLPLPMDVLRRDGSYLEIQVPTNNSVKFVNQHDVTTETDDAKRSSEAREAVGPCSIRGATSAPMGMAKGPC
jgi:hypothetical protein